MMKYFIYVIFLITLISCYSKDKLPSDIIKPEEMKSIMWDVMRSQALANELALKDSTIDRAIKTKLLAKKVFEIHKTDSVHFNESYNWYVKHPLRLKLIFDSLYAQKQRLNSFDLRSGTKHPMINQHPK